jgi:SpoIIAA-like
MQFEAHGKFDITLKGDIFFIKMSHKWNLEGAEKFFSKYETLVRQHNLKKYGVLSDLTDFEGGTPDAIQYFEKISDRAQIFGQVARALIMNSDLKEFMVNQADNGKERFPTRIFSEETEAIAWLESLGLVVS